MRLTAALALPWVVSLSCLASSCGSSAAETTPLPVASASVPGESTPETYRHDVVPLEMRNVHLHLDPGIVLHIRRLRGRMISRVSGRAPVFDEPRSYHIDLDSADLSIDTDSLTSLMNDHLFSYDGAPLDDIHVDPASDGRLHVKGKLKKGITLPFSSNATVGVTPDGRLRLHVESFKALGLPATGLLKAFGLELDDLVSLKRRRDVSINDNDIEVAPGEALPPPAIHGRLTAAAVNGGQLALTFGSDRARSAKLRPPDPAAPNYIYFGGGDVRFGKLTMSRADLQLIDLDRRDPFDFYPARYNAQLVAGYSKNTPQLGLKTYMPDFDDLARKRQ